MKCIASERSQNTCIPQAAACIYNYACDEIHYSQLSPNHSSLFPLLLSAMFPNDVSISCSLSLEIAGSSSAFGSTSTTCSTYT